MKSYDNFSWLNMREMEPIVKHTDPTKSEKKAATEPAGNSLPEAGAKTENAEEPVKGQRVDKTIAGPSQGKTQKTEAQGRQIKPAELNKSIIPSNAREIEKKETATRNNTGMPSAFKESKGENLSKEILSTNVSQNAAQSQKDTASESKKSVQAGVLHQSRKSPVTPEIVEKTNEAKEKTAVSSSGSGTENKQHTKTGTSPIPAIQVGTGNTGQIAKKPLSGITESQPVKAKSAGDKKADKPVTTIPNSTTETSKDVKPKKDKKLEEKTATVEKQKNAEKPVFTPVPAVVDSSVNKAVPDKTKKESTNTFSGDKKETNQKLAQGKKPDLGKESPVALGEEETDNSSDAAISSKQGAQLPKHKLPGKATVIAAAAIVVALFAGVLLVPRFFHKGSEDVVLTEEEGNITEDTSEDDELDADQTAETQELETGTIDEVDTTELDEEDEKIYGLLSSFWLTNVNTSEWADWPQATNESDEDVIVFIRVTSPMEMLKERDADGNLAEFEMEEDIYLFLQDEDDRDTATENHFDENWIELAEVSRQVVEFNGNDEGKGYTYIFAYHCPLGTGESSTTLFDTFKIKSGISSTIEDGENEAIKVQVLAVPTSEVKRLISGADTTGEISEANLTEYYKYFYETAG